MELRAYIAILRRRWWIPLLLMILTLALTIIGQRPWQVRPSSYTLGLSFSVGVQPQAGQGDYNYDGYYSALASEYLIDDFSEIVKGSAFAAEVARLLADQGLTVAPGSIQGSTQAGKLHRILNITLYGGDADQLNAIADAVTGAMTEAPHLFMPRLLADQGAVYLVNRGQPAVIGPSLRQRLDLPLRLALALIAGVLIVFLLDYLDDRLRDPRQLEALGIPVLGEIPRR